MATAKEKIVQHLESFPEKTRKQLIDELNIPRSTIDTVLRKLTQEKRIKYKIVRTTPYREKGMKHFVKSSNPNVRAYFLVNETGVIAAKPKE